MINSQIPQKQRSSPWISYGIILFTAIIIGFLFRGGVLLYSHMLEAKGFERVGLTNASHNIPSDDEVQKLIDIIRVQEEKLK